MFFLEISIFLKVSYTI